jgi:4-phospho-D-threonate 3-dehydrogenase / 4-phospho-D-erythronate 3-dehydrogenase
VTRPAVAVTMGDPSGIGPEIVVKALAGAEPHRLARLVVVGDATRLHHAARLSTVDVTVHPVDGVAGGLYRQGTVDCLDLRNVPEGMPFGQLSREAGEAAYQYVAAAADLAVTGEVQAICTAPLNKAALHAAGHRYPGHTELLAELTGTPEVSMMLTAPGLRVIHVTTHVGLLDAVARIEPGLVERTIRRGHETLLRAGIARPRIAVCGINPHAGENGLFGRGEEARIVPAVTAVVADGVDAVGPLPADAALFRAVRGDFDLVVAM